MTTKLTRQYRRKLIRDLRDDPGLSKEWIAHKAINERQGLKIVVWWRHYKELRKAGRPVRESWKLAGKWTAQG